MERSLVQAFLMGFAIATALYVAISVLAWIRKIPGMDQEDSLALVERTNGKFLSEIMEEGHLRIGEMATLPKALADKQPNPTHTVRGPAGFTRELMSLYSTAESTGAKKSYVH